MITNVTPLEQSLAKEVERLENELLSATLRIDNDKLTIEGLTREQVGLALDAARYRAIRFGECDFTGASGEAFDAAVDAAMKWETK
jgi:hypothetical protein